MSYFVVKLNGALTVCAGSPDVSVLTAAVIGTKRGPAQLTVSGLSTTLGQSKHQFWPSHTLAENDRIEIAYLAECEPTEPANVVVQPERSVEELLAELRASSARVRSQVPRAPMETPVARQHRLSVSTGAGSQVEASLGDSENLQAVVCLAGGTCKIEVDSLTVQSDGSTRGVRWLVEPVVLGKSVSLTYAT